MHIDHHLQARIIDELWQGERSFSELKLDGIENSLFMYHLRKLIARGIVAKTERGYSLTPDGARWAHKLDHASYRPLSGPRTLVQLFVVEDGRLLISERQGVTAEHMNRYLLPSAFHAFGMSSEHCADDLAKRLGITRERYMTHGETIWTEQQLHVLSDIYVGRYRAEVLPPNEPQYHYRWLGLEEVASMSPSAAGALPMIVRKYLDGTLADRELVAIN